MGLAKGNTNNKSGRPKGIKDRRHHYHNVVQALENAGFDPVQAMIEIARTADDVGVRRQATKDLLDRVSPALKSIEHKGEIGTYYVLNVGLKENSDRT